MMELTIQLPKGSVAKKATQISVAQDSTLRKLKAELVRANKLKPDSYFFYYPEGAPIKWLNDDKLIQAHNLPQNHFYGTGD